ncbi:hypothetical protein [Rhodococcus sp. T7]|uniref:hypothetical protein n=1 Tax=Rhodococcus sp. T7 TaxID=627444 RepID=UPI001358D68D|nr:hypothetical protein [Rhodococcus sp. T7]KAF0959441.1 hypothetical protein MLGJGCBP_07477 [Rhodococcus sp. T7]
MGFGTQFEVVPELLPQVAYQLLRGIEPAWADAWLAATRAALTAAGADGAVFDMLPTPS